MCGHLHNLKPGKLTYVTPSGSAACQLLLLQTKPSFAAVSSIHCTAAILNLDDAVTVS